MLPILKTPAALIRALAQGTSFPQSKTEHQGLFKNVQAKKHRKSWVLSDTTADVYWKVQEFSLP